MEEERRNEVARALCWGGLGALQMRKDTQGGETARHVNERRFVSSSYDGRSKGQRRRAQTR